MVKVEVVRPDKYDNFDCDSFRLVISLLDEGCLRLPGPEAVTRHTSLQVLSDVLPPVLRANMEAELRATWARIRPEEHLGLQHLFSHIESNYGPLLSLIPALLEPYMGLDADDMTVRRFAILSEAPAGPERGSENGQQEGEDTEETIDPAPPLPLLPADLLPLGFSPLVVSELEALAIKASPLGPLNLRVERAASEEAGPGPGSMSAVFSFQVKPVDPDWTLGVLVVQGRCGPEGSSASMSVVGPLTVSLFIRNALSLRLNAEVTEGLGRRNFLRRAVGSLENRGGQWLGDAIQRAQDLEEELALGRSDEQEHGNGRPTGDGGFEDLSEGSEGIEDEETENEGECEEEEGEGSSAESYEPGGGQGSSGEDVPSLRQASRAESTGHVLTRVQLQLEGLKLLCDAVEPYKFSLQVACSRCGAPSDLSMASDAVDAAVKKDGAWFVREGACTGCSQPLAAAFIPRIAHGGSNTVALLRSEGCRLVDLLPQGSTWGAQCGTCAATVTLRDVQPSVPCSRQCTSCFKRVGLFYSIPAFVQLQPLSGGRGRPWGAFTAAGGGKGRGGSGGGGGQMSSLALAFQQPRVLGQPLPATGTCRHYPHSHRWLRFPCCGKVFPCDLCHEEMADHDVRWAMRCICGFCSGEQPCAKSCRFCGKAMTTSAGDPRGTGTRFWEGGRGCRDPRKMSSKDPKKAKLLTGGKYKTKSKKSSRVGEEGKKRREKAGTRVGEQGRQTTSQGPA